MNGTLEREILLCKLGKHLGKERIGHSLGVEACAVEMANRFGADQKKAGVAGLVHDCAKELGIKQAMILGERLGIFEDKWLRAQPALWHAPLGAYVAREVYGVTDPEVLASASCHTTGMTGISTLDKVIYLADYIEPGRSFEGVDELRAHARHDLDKALVLAFDTTIRYLMQNEKAIHPQTVLARNEAIFAGNKE